MQSVTPKPNSTDYERQREAAYREKDPRSWLRNSGCINHIQVSFYIADIDKLRLLQAQNLQQPEKRLIVTHP